MNFGIVIGTAFAKNLDESNPILVFEQMLHDWIWSLMELFCLLLKSIKDHIQSCSICSKTKIGLDSFKIFRKCRSDYDAKIHEALLIKKHSPSLNRQLYASGASFLLQVF